MLGLVLLDGRDGLTRDHAFALLLPGGAGSYNLMPVSMCLENNKHAVVFHF